MMPRPWRAGLETNDRYGQNVIASNLSFRRIHDFMADAGTTFASLDREFRNQPTQEECLALCQQVFEGERFTASRWVIDGKGLGRVIVRNEQGAYLNKYHRYLEQKLNGDTIEAGGGEAATHTSSLEGQQPHSYILEAQESSWPCAVM